MPRRTVITQLGSLLRQVASRNARFIVTKSAKPTAVLLEIADFDDVLDELDPAPSGSPQASSLLA